MWKSDYLSTHLVYEAPIVLRNRDKHKLVNYHRKLKGILFRILKL